MWWLVLFLGSFNHCYAFVSIGVNPIIENTGSVPAKEC